MKPDFLPDDIPAQLARFVTAGVGVAVLSVLLYWVLAVPLRVAPMIANVASYALNVILGFFAHRHWSFAGHADDVAVRPAATRYFVISLLALAMNSVWVLILTSWLSLPPWTPILPMVFVTPLVTFICNRQWVFRIGKVGAQGR